MIAPIGLALLAAACGETRGQRTATGATGGALAGALIAGPVGALVGAGAGAATGAYRDQVDDTVGTQTQRAARQIEQARQSDTAQAGETASAPEAYAQQALRDEGPPLSNEEVREAQTALQAMGLFDGEVDGLYGRRTISAVGEFQTQQNLPRTMALDQRTQQQLQQVAESGPPPAEPGSQVGEQPPAPPAGAGEAPPPPSPSGTAEPQQSTP